MLDFTPKCTYNIPEKPIASGMSRPQPDKLLLICSPKNNSKAIDNNFLERQQKLNFQRTSIASTLISSSILGSFVAGMALNRYLNLGKH